MDSTTRKWLRIAGAALALAVVLPQAALAVDAVTTSPTKIYAAVGGPFSFTVTLPAGNATSTTDLLVEYTVNTTSPVIVPYALCIDPATPAPYDGAPPSSKYVNWDAGLGIFPSAAACGAAAGAITLATFSGTANAIPGGAYTITVRNNFAAADPNVTSNDVTICGKPTVTSVTPPAAAAEGTSQDFTINFAPAIAVGCDGVTIPSTLSGPATAAPDLANIFSTTCTNMSAGASSCLVTVHSTDNALFNGDQAMTLTVTNSTGASNYVSVNMSAAGTVQDNESGISVALGRNGAEGGNSVQFNVTCVQGSAAGAPAAALVNLAWAGAAPAATAADFTGGLPASIPAAVCSTGVGTVTQIDLPVVDDALVEGSENLQLTISSGTPSVVARAPTSATATVADNDTPPVFGLTQTGACAEAVVPTNCQFDIVRESGVSGPFTVNFTVAGTATRGTDYTLNDTTCGGAVIAGNSVSHINAAPAGVFTIAVCVLDDAILEPGGETVVLSLSPAATYTLGAVSSQTQTIADDEIGVGVVATTASITEGGTAMFTISCTGIGSVTVDYSFSGTYTPLPGPDSTLLDCGTPVVISVPTEDDAIANGTRTITLTIDSIGAAGTAPINRLKKGVGTKALVIDPAHQSATVQVLDNDAPRIIPTMNSLGLILLGLLLAVAAGFGIRRKA